MTQQRSGGWVAAFVAMFVFAVGAAASAADAEDVQAELSVEPGHAWLPPFDLERVGSPRDVRLTLRNADQAAQRFEVAAFIDGEEVGRHAAPVAWQQVEEGEADHGVGRVRLESLADEVALYVVSAEGGEPRELARAEVDYPQVEADAIAKPETRIHPVDLGTVFVPHHWLILATGQTPVLEIAAMAHEADLANVRLRAWFASSPDDIHEQRLSLPRRQRVTQQVMLETLTPSGENDTLHVAIIDRSGQTLWDKAIETMIVTKQPELPEFGATALKLRYDLPITVNHGEDGELGELTFLDYDEAWDPSLNDVVVSLPDGSRYVFWRGSSYVPFWVDKSNTAVAYEWAETQPPPDAFVDSVEPLMDKELRYGRVEIIESTAARVHVRWTYQSTSFLYEVFGDETVEDYYFYPDGFGTRVVNLKHRPGAEYELTEFIVLSAPGAYPFAFLPAEPVAMVFLDGRRVDVPSPPGPGAEATEIFEQRPEQSVVYRIQPHREAESTAIYFHASDDHYPMGQFGPFHEEGQMVTPVYWGSHWPLSRGKATGASIDDRIEISPAHNSIMTWGFTNRPPSLERAQVRTLDALGESRQMVLERWAWLIGMTDESDERVIAWGKSFAEPPSLEVEGAQVAWQGYAAERRAMRLAVKDDRVSIVIKPTEVTVNPVFELQGAKGKLRAIHLDGEPLDADRYAWDGRTLWIEATIREPQRLELEFE